MVEIAVLRGLEAAKKVVLLGVEGFQHLDHIRPVDVRVGVNVNVPVVVGALLVGHVRLAHVLVLVQVPRLTASVAPFLAALLVDETFLLATPQIEVTIVIFSFADSVAEDVVDTVAHDGLFHIGENEEIGQALGHGHELGGEAVVGLAGTRLDDEEDLGKVGEMGAGWIDPSFGQPVILGEDLLLCRGKVQLRWRFFVFNVGIRFRGRRYWCMGWCRVCGSILRGRLLVVRRPEGERRREYIECAVVEVRDENEDGKDDGNAHDGDGREVHLSQQHGGRCV